MVRYNDELNKTSVKTNRDLSTKSLVKSAIDTLKKYSDQVQVDDCIVKIRLIHSK